MPRTSIASWISVSPKAFTAMPPPDKLSDPGPLLGLTSSLAHRSVPAQSAPPRISAIPAEEFKQAVTEQFATWKDYLDSVRDIGSERLKTLLDETSAKIAELENRLYVSESQLHAARQRSLRMPRHQCRCKTEGLRRHKIRRAGHDERRQVLRWAQ